MRHLDAEYLAVLETDNATPYFLNLHNGEVPHTLILGNDRQRQIVFLQLRSCRTRRNITH